LRAVLASAAARSVRADADAARQDAAQARALAGQLRDLRIRVEPSTVEALRGRASEAVTAEQAVELAAREFAGLPGVVSARTRGGDCGRQRASSASRQPSPSRLRQARAVYCACRR
jgi:hypothetical protein